MPEVRELTATEFSGRWPGGERENIELLDVREHAEIEIASVAGATHIPMMEIPHRLDELSREKEIVVMCHSGARSRRVAEFLASSGFEQVFNLTGGIDAWSREVDPSVPRY